MNTTTQKTSIKGAEWLIKESTVADTFVPEEFNEEQKMVKDMCATFLDNDVIPDH